MRKQQENIRTLLELIHENPELRIVPMVETGCVADDCCAWWVASWGKATVAEVYFNDERERAYIKDHDHDSLVDEEYERFFDADIDEETIMKSAREKVDDYPWEKVIAVKIET